MGRSIIPCWSLGSSWDYKTEDEFGGLTFSTDHESKSIKHTDVNVTFLQMEFGINAGLPFFS